MNYTITIWQRAKRLVVVKKNGFMKLIKSALFFLLLISVGSCGNRNVLSPEQMTDLLVDLHLAEGVAISQSKTFRNSENKLNLYTTVYSKHNTDKAQFDSSMVYYSENLVELSEIYEEVYARITELEVQVEVGHFAPSTTMMNEKAYARMVVQDRDILPFVDHEIWNGRRYLSLHLSDFSKGKTTEVDVDTLLNRQLELRYTIESESLTSASCTVMMTYDGGEIEEKVFDLPLANERLVMHSFTVENSPKTITVRISGEPINDDAKLELTDFRLYDVAPEAHNIRLFQ